jgi:hypothetical protein
MGTSPSAAAFAASARASVIGSGSGQRVILLR